MTDPRDKRDGDPLALAAAVSYGVSDFAGGVLTRRAHVFVVGAHGTHSPDDQDGR